MYPEEREYRVGSSGFTMSRGGADVRFEPGALVWLRSVPQGADLSPTGQGRRYETKVSAAGEPVFRIERTRGWRG